MEKKRLLIFYAPGGNGHKSNAMTLKETFKRKYPEHEVIVEDAADFGNPFLDFSLGIYDDMLKLEPKLVHYGYTFLNFLGGDRNLVPIFPNVTKRIGDYIKKIKPDIIISVHSSVNNFIVSAMKKEGLYNKIPFIIICTDMSGNFIKAWANQNANLIITFLNESKKYMLKLGIHPEKVKVLGGMPVNPLFTDNALSKEEARKKLGLDEDVFTVFLMSGGVGINSLHTMAKMLSDSKLPIQMIACCGKNAELEKKVNELAKTSKKKIKVFGFSNQIHNLMDASDVIICKPGPAVIAESIVKALPIILDNMTKVMPQEQGNLEYVLDKNVGKSFTQLSELHNQIATFIYDELEYPKIKANMKQLSKTESSSKLVDLLLKIANEGVTREVKLKSIENS